MPSRSIQRASSSSFGPPFRIASNTLARSAADSQARAELSSLADLTAAALDRGVTDSRGGEPLPRRVALVGITRAANQQVAFFERIRTDKNLCQLLRVHGALSTAAGV